MFAGCGYHLAASGDALPPTAKTIYVERFENHTRQTGLNDEFMRYIKDDIALHDRLRIVDTPGLADLALSGEIVYYNSTATAFNSAQEPTLYGLAMTVSAQLKDVHANRVIWLTRSVSNTQRQPVVAQAVVATTPTFLQQNLRASDIAQMTDIQTAQTQSYGARDEMMKQVAGNLYASMAEGF
jgi:hypothetical protein